MQVAVVVIFLDHTCERKCGFKNIRKLFAIVLLKSLTFIYIHHGIERSVRFAQIEDVCGRIAELGCVLKI